MRKYTDEDKTSMVKAVNAKRAEGMTIKDSLEWVKKNTPYKWATGSLYTWWDATLKGVNYLPKKKPKVDPMDRITGPIMMALGGGGHEEPQQQQQPPRRATTDESMEMLKERNKAKALALLEKILES